jgi:hypothetical protein
MKTDDANKPSTMAPTSTNAPSPTEADQKSSLTEAQYLDRQAEEARRAISQVFADIKHELAEGADPRQWAKAYPWWTMAGSLAAGFVAAAGVIPSKEDQALKRLAKLEKALHPPPPPVSEDGERHRDHERGGLLSALGHELISAVKPVLLSALTAGVGGRMARSGPQKPEAPQNTAPPAANVGRDI